MHGVDLSRWTAADGPLDLTAAAARIGAVWPELAPVRATSLGEGWDCRIVEVNDAYVFRFPKRSEIGARLARERVLLAGLAGTLPLPIPDVRFWAEPGGDFPFGLAGHVKIPGATAVGVALAADAERRVAEELARFMAALHAIPPERARQLGAVERDVLANDPPALLALVRRLYPGLRPALPAPVVERCLRFLSAAPPAPRQRPACLVHGELTANNVLVSDEGEAVTGIIDWTDACLGDPAGDLGGLFHWGGERMLAAALAVYPGAAADPTLSERARFIGGCGGFIQLAVAVDRGDAGQRAAAERALSHL
jgi:aminoglycoside phosphotransferase (APT) family kinase protein